MLGELTPNGALVVPAHSLPESRTLEAIHQPGCSSYNRGAARLTASPVQAPIFLSVGDYMARALLPLQIIYSTLLAMRDATTWIS